jgi:CDGSH-type Zn-finger protein
MEIQVRDNGPYFVQGPVTVKDGAGKVYDLTGRAQFALCRCGQSKNKPFCDGSHAGAGFQSKCVAP